MTTPDPRALLAEMRDWFEHDPGAYWALDWQAVADALQAALDDRDEVVAALRALRWEVNYTNGTGPRCIECHAQQTLAGFDQEGHNCALVKLLTRHPAPAGEPK